MGIFAFYPLEGFLEGNILSVAASMRFGGKIDTVDSRWTSKKTPGLAEISCQSVNACSPLRTLGRTGLSQPPGSKGFQNQRERTVSWFSS